MSEPRTKAGRWLLDRARWDEGMRGFFVRINATAGPDDMHRHILAIESEAGYEAADRAAREARADLAARIVAAVEELPRHSPDDRPVVRLAAVLDAIREASDDRRA